MQQHTQNVFYSFYFGNDISKVYDFNALWGDSDKERVQAHIEYIMQPTNIKIEQWIDAQIKKSECVIVLIGDKTADRIWVQYEIEKAWKLQKPIFGLRVHDIDMKKCYPEGPNPFKNFILKPRCYSLTETLLSTKINVYHVNRSKLKIVKEDVVLMVEELQDVVKTSLRKDFPNLIKQTIKDFTTGQKKNLFADYDLSKGKT